MATPQNDSYSFASGATLRCGRFPPAGLSNVILTASDQYGATATLNQPFVFDLHGSGTNPMGLGERYSATLANGLEYLGDVTYQWAIIGTSGMIRCKPWDRQIDNGVSRRESYHCGWTHGPASPKTMGLFSERRMDALYAWMSQRYPQASATKRVLRGDSMGAWGTMTYGIRRPTMFSMLLPSRPRVRYSSAGAGFFAMADWDTTQATWTPATTPLLDAADGGGTAWDHQNIIAYVSDTGNNIPWIGVTIGRQDGYMPWQDHIDFIAALRATKRGFAYSWNDGNHSTYPAESTITNSYPYGLIEIGKGYPLFTNHSGDADPAVDLVGGINLGLTFRNVVESAAGWSCQVTSILGARTVTVEPKSTVFTTTVTPQTITIPAANSWVSVSFSA